MTDDVKLPCGCTVKAVAEALDATGMELHQQDCGLQTGYGICAVCYHLKPEHDDTGCQHDMGDEWAYGADGDGERVYCGCTRHGDVCIRCRTCGGHISTEDRRCTCWALLAGALQQYAGYGFDDAAQLAGALWDDTGDHDRVWAGKYLDETMPGAGTPDSIVAALARMDYPNDNFGYGGCALCGEEPTFATQTDAAGNSASVPDPALQQHKPSCPWRQAKEWMAR